MIVIITVNVIVIITVMIVIITVMIVVAVLAHVIIIYTNYGLPLTSVLCFSVPELPELNNLTIE